MLERSEHSNLLEQRSYTYSLQDVAEPHLYREIFQYDEVPKIPFNHRRVPMHMPEEIFITDTSFRDGQQSQAPYSPEQIVELYKLLSRLGGPKGIIRQTEFFVYNDRDREAVRRCQDLGLEFPEITTWIRATKNDFKLVRDLGIKETGILVSCSDYHIFHKLGMTRREAIDHYLAVISEAFEAGVRPRCHLEDITRADFYGFVLPFVYELHQLSVVNDGIFRCLEVEKLSGQAKENAKKNIDAYFTFLSKEKKEAAAHFANLYVQGTYPKAAAFMACECQVLTMSMVLYVKSIR